MRDNSVTFGTYKTNRMRKKILVAFMLLSVTLYAQKEKDREVCNSIRVEATDTDDEVMAKAAHVVPTTNQWEALNNEFIAFVHFGPNTFTRMEWGTGKESPETFDLKELDTDQWCEAMKAAGMKMVILTVKHHDGFVLWQSRYTSHGIMATGYRDGKGDVLKELSASCRKFGLKLGIYLSPADLFQIESPDGLYGNGSTPILRTIPREVPGRPFRNQTRFRFVVDDYNEYFLNQLFELLTEYGPVHEVWFDGAHPRRKGGQKYNYKAWRELIRTLAPEATIFGREDVRWCGNEAGRTRESEWNVIGAYDEDPASQEEFRDLHGDLGTRHVLLSRERPYYLHYQPAEVNTSIRDGWFYRDDVHQRVRTADDVFDMYERAVGGNSIFLLNIPPNREGRFSSADVSVLREVGSRIRETYGLDLLQGADGPGEVLDGNEDTGLLLDGAVKEFVIAVPEPITLNRFVLQEAVRTGSERVEQYALDAWMDGQWKEIARGTNIGYKRILRFPEVTTGKLRVRITSSRLSPVISRVSAHYYRQRLPELRIWREVDGGVHIAGELPEGVRVHYTTDGSVPDSTSPVYTGPVFVENALLKAAAFEGEERGPVCEKRFGLLKRDWKASASVPEDAQHPLKAAFDEQPATYWMVGQASLPATFCLDLGRQEPISGFAYTPQQEHKEGMITGGTVEVSSDGKQWSKAGDFTFGNLVNDPTRRFHYFKEKVEGRYLRIVITSTEGGSRTLSMAELDVF